MQAQTLGLSRMGFGGAPLGNCLHRLQTARLQRVATLAALLGQSAGRLEELAGQADRDASGTLTMEQHCPK
jgi:hypothetical protein